MPDLTLFALLVVAIVIGYTLGRYSCQGRFGRKDSDSDSASTVSKNYFIGLNYLLNEQPDEAIDIFINALDITNDAIETHLALGALFCKRGDVERSIRIHQDLLARPSLSASQSLQVQLELAKDYVCAGLFDRAEAILVDLVKRNHEFRDEALYQLLKIYEQEKEWLKAIEAAENLKKKQELALL